jgi:hypothetical protein
MTTLERIDDPASFLRAAGAFLLEREAEHNLMLGLAARLVDEPDGYGEPAYEAVIRRGDGTIVAAALRTPPFNLILSELDDPAAVELLAADALDRFGELPGVLGPSTVAARFAETWRELTGAPTELALAQRIHRADRVVPPAGVPGSARVCTRDDRPLLLAWIDAFLAEALPADLPRESTSEHLARRERDPDAGYLVWESQGEPVSVAGWGGPTPNGNRIGPVYTPPEHRRRGFASAVTAALTERLLRDGKRFCFLFTDLANPTSNAIYRRIGYEPVSDVDAYGFGAKRA